MALSTSGNLSCIIVAALGRVPGGGAEESPHLLAHVVVLRESAAVRLVEGAGAPRLKAGAATHGVAVPPAKVLLAVEERHVVLVWKHALRAGHARTVHGWCSTRLCARAVPRRSETRAPGVGVLSLSLAEEAAVIAPCWRRRKNSGLATTTFFAKLGGRKNGTHPTSSNHADRLCLLPRCVLSVCAHDVVPPAAILQLHGTRTATGRVGESQNVIFGIWYCSVR